MLQPLQAADVSRPNILLIYTDDHGWADLGVQKSDPNIRTPNIDQLAKDGIRFTRGYVSAPQCVPSRAGLLSGRYQQKFGVEDNGKGPLPHAEITIAERLKAAGYVTGQVGKWHLDLRNADKKKDLRVDPAFFPHTQGFDEYWRGELKQFFASHDLAGNAFPDAPHLVRDERFRVIVQTDAALSFLQRRASKPETPWFMYLAWYAPHVPLDSPEPWFSNTPENLPIERRKALSMIAAMDDGLGRIRAQLKDMGQDKNTLIFLISDNGAPLGDSWNGSLNLPMRGQKGMLSEGGIRVPFVAAWPGKLPSGVEYNESVINLDVAATAVALAGLPADPVLDGVNLMPFLTGEKKGPPHDTLYWRWGSQAAIQEYPYKLIALGDRERLLFDISTPEGENVSRNLLSKKPDLASRLESKLKQWSETLTPPGLPTSLDKHHETLFSEHEISAKAEAQLAREKKQEGAVNGWLCRNGTISADSGALRIIGGETAAKNARVFITNSDLDLPGPLTATLRIRSKSGGTAYITWRTSSASFTPEQTASFEWPASEEWREVDVALPEKENVIHVRITPPKSVDPVEVQSVTFVGKKGERKRWLFNASM
jgi:arylsulfatase A-like enzyme